MHLWEKLEKRSFHTILYKDDLVLMSNFIEGIQKKFANWKDSLESKDLKTNNQKIKLMVSGSKGGIRTSKIDLCGVREQRVTKNFMLFMNCRKCINGRCAK